MSATETYLSLWRGEVAYRPPLPTMREIATEVATRNGLELADLRGRSRLRSVYMVRHEAMWTIGRTGPVLQRADRPVLRRP
jgi:hypothetical protein